MDMKQLPIILSLLALLSLGFDAAAYQDDPAYVKPGEKKDASSDSSDVNTDSQDGSDDDDESKGVIIQQDDSGTIEGFGDTWQGLKRLERIQFLSNIATLRNSPTLLPFHAPDTTFDFNKPQPVPLNRSDIDPVFGSPFSPIMTPIRNLEAYLGDTLGMNFGIYYTLLYQHVTNGVANTPRNQGTGRLDVNLVWNLWEYPVVGRKDEAAVGHGLLGILVRQGNQIGVPNDMETSMAAGSFQGLNSLYTGQFGGAATLNLLYYQQGFFNDRAVVSVGKIHPNQYIGLNFWANDESRQFLAGPFDGIQPLGSSQGGYSLGVALQLIPSDSIFINAVATDALGSPETMFSTVDEGFLWTSVEAGLLLPGFVDEFGGPTALSVIWSGQNLDAFSTGPNYERTWSNALALQVQGHLSEQVGYWAQGGIAEPDMSSTSAQFSCGIGIEEPLGRRGDLFGVAYNWSKPSDNLQGISQSGSQSLVEMFYRIQLTGSLQLSPDIQIVVDGSLPGANNYAVVFGLRLTTDF